MVFRVRSVSASLILLPTGTAWLAQQPPLNTWRRSSQPTAPSRAATIVGTANRRTQATATSSTSPAGVDYDSLFDEQAWRNGYSTVTSETCVALSGTSFPSDLRGTFFQNGYAQFEVGDEPVVHPFDASGMVTAVTFDGANQASWFRNRFVQTPVYRRERATGRIQERGVFGTEKNRGKWWSNCLDVQVRNVANTHVVLAQRRDKNPNTNNDDDDESSSSSATLYALFEAGKPFALDPVTLETLTGEESDLNGTLKPSDRYAAHYRVDPATGNIVNFGLGVTDDELLLDPNAWHRVTMYEHSSDLQTLVDRRSFKLPGFGFAHDAVVTPNFLILLQPPTRFEALPFALGYKALAQCILPDGDPATATTRVHLLPRAGKKNQQQQQQHTKAPVSIDIPYVFSFHLANAFEDPATGRVVLDANVAPTLFMADMDRPTTDPTPLWETVNLRDSNPQFPGMQGFQITRYELDPATAQLTSPPRILSSDRNANVDFPVHHPRLTGQHYRYVYTVASAHPTVRTPHRSIAKIDVQRGQTVDKWTTDHPYEFVSEFAFAPRHSNSTEAEFVEDDGYLVGYVMNGRDRQTSVVVLDAQTMQPVAKAVLPTFLSHSLHGTFVPDFCPPLP